MVMDVSSDELTLGGPHRLYEQLSGIFRRRIASGFWPVHHKLLAEPDLASTFKVSRGTVRVAIGQLVKEGLLIQVQGKGTFVRAHEAPSRNPLLSLGELLEQSSVAYETSVLSSRVVDTHDQYADLIGPGPYFQLRRVRSVREGPVSFMENVLSLAICAGIVGEDLEYHSLYQVLEGHLGLNIGRASRTFSALAADAELAGMLDLDEGAPVLEIDQVTRLKDGRPFEFAQFWIRTDRHKLVADFERGGPGA
jgi:DNA-binding GntR family transcriptional regulator